MQGAISQSFRGTAGREGCHAIPAQLVLDNQFPHQLRDGSGQPYNNSFLRRSINMFARCTLQPKVVNAVDTVLDWHPEVEFSDLYKEAVRNVLAGSKAVDTFRAFETRKGAHPQRSAPEIPR